MLRPGRALLRFTLNFALVALAQGSIAIARHIKVRGERSADELLAQEQRIAFGFCSSGGAVISRKPRESRIVKRPGQVRAGLFVCLLALLGLLIGGGNTQANDSKVFAGGRGFLGANDTFAIDDFDGDLAPDIASVQPVSSDSSGSNYLVQLQFGSGERRSIWLASHRRGVRIVARDVNGDRIPDLIIRSAWGEEPYAVLINEGNGAFSPVDPSSAQALSRESRQSLACPRPRPSETVATPPSSEERGFAKTKCAGHTCSTKRSVYQRNSISVRCPLLVSLPGHAPPALL